jgi:plasmid maintenance system antidote protein VapI
MTVSEQLREAIRNCGLSANELARLAEVPQPTITRFLNNAELRSGNIDKLAAYFGLVLKKERKR